MTRRGRTDATISVSASLNPAEQRILVEMRIGDCDDSPEPLKVMQGAAAEIWS